MRFSQPWAIAACERGRDAAADGQNLAVSRHLTPSCARAATSSAPAQRSCRSRTWSCSGYTAGEKWCGVAWRVLTAFSPFSRLVGGCRRTRPESATRLGTINTSAAVASFNFSWTEVPIEFNLIWKMGNHLLLSLSSFVWGVEAEKICKNNNAVKFCRSSAHSSAILPFYIPPVLTSNYYRPEPNSTAAGVLSVTCMSRSSDSVPLPA